ncbi:MAG: SDR family NAD(P)-dependent oxidoreductase [Myxococcales bacterium]|nr:SDR family NAD(P)-dependent oxidoreductase [Myxococcales bacterium]
MRKDEAVEVPRGAFARLTGSMLWQRSRLAPPSPHRVDGKLAVVTGGNGGIGFATARGLLQRGARVVLACRDEARGAAAARALESETAGWVRVLVCDLADLISVDAAVEALRRFDPVDVLVANAGVWPRRFAQTAQGVEIAVGVNVLGHLRLIEGLVSAGRIAESGRVVILTGDIYVMVGDCPLERTYTGALGGQWAYCSSKLGNLWMRSALEVRHPALRWFAVHPGVVASDLAGAPQWTQPLARRLLLTPEEGARTSIRCATDPSASAGYHHAAYGRVQLPGDDVAADLERARAFVIACEARMDALLATAPGTPG